MSSKILSSIIYILVAETVLGLNRLNHVNGSQQDIKRPSTSNNLRLLFVFDSSTTYDNSQTSNENHLDELQAYFIGQIVREFVSYRPPLVAGVLSYSDESVESILDPQRVSDVNVNNVIDRIRSQMTSRTKQNLGVGRNDLRMSTVSSTWGLERALDVLATYSDMSSKSTDSTVVVVWLAGSRLSDADLASLSTIRLRMSQRLNWNLLVVGFNDVSSSLNRLGKQYDLSVIDWRKMAKIKEKIRSMSNSRRVLTKK